MNWGWYLQNDVQMFIVSGLLLLIYKKSKFMGSYLIVLCTLGSYAYTMSYNFSHNFKQAIHL